MSDIKEPPLTGVKPTRVVPSFKNEILGSLGGETLKVCFNCGTCTSSCPIARFTTSFRPRRILQMAQLGLKSKVLSSDTLWFCAACFTCTDRCPQGVEVAGVLRVFRNMAVKEGFVPLVFKEQASSIVHSGYAYDLKRSQLKKREKAGLPLLPKSNVEDLTKLADATGLSKLIEEKPSNA